MAPWREIICYLMVSYVWQGRHGIIMPYLNHIAVAHDHPCTIGNALYCVTRYLLQPRQMNAKNGSNFDSSEYAIDFYIFRSHTASVGHDGVIEWKYFPRYWALCEGNPPVIGGFPSQRPVTGSFDAFFDLPDKRLSKRSGCQRFETQSRSLWRHCNALLLLGAYRMSQDDGYMTYTHVDDLFAPQILSFYLELVGSHL